MRARSFVIAGPALAAALVVTAPAVRAQPSGPAAEAQADVDGDGQPDRLRIEAPGQLVLELAAGGGQRVPFGLSGALTDARLTVAPGAGGAIVAASARLGGVWEGVGLRWDKGRLRELWRGPVGPTDDDEYQRWLAAAADGLIRYQERADLVRCDGPPLALFRERWDERAGGFRPAAATVRIPDSLAVVKASAASAGAVPGWYRPTITSSAAGATDAGQLVAPQALADGDLATRWSPGEAGDGIGAAITFRTRLRGGAAASLRITPGGATAAAAKDHLRVARLAVLGAGGGAVIELPDPLAGPAAGRDPTQAYRASLPSTLDGCVTVVVVATYKGGAPAGAHLAIPELAVVADVEEAPGGLEPVLAASVAAGGLSGESAARALSARGAAAVSALTARLAAAAPDERRRLFTALAGIGDPAVLTPVADALAAGELGPIDVEPLLDRLLALEPAPPAEGELTALLRTGARAGRPLGDPARSALARAVAHRWHADNGLTTGAGLALRDAAGTGGPGLRAELATLLAAAGAPALVAAIAAEPARPPGWQADLWRAAGRAAARASLDVQRTTGAAMASALDGADDHERRYRLVVGLAAIAAGDELARLQRWLAAHDDSPSDRGLRRLAAAGLARNPHADARLAVIDLVRDPDPGTRLAAIRGLASADEPTDRPTPRPMVTGDDDLVRDGGDRALSAALAQDRWPELRREAAAALATRCQRPGPREALEHAVADVSVLPVRIEALAALVTCHAPGIELRLLAVADDGAAPLDLRDRALGLYGALPGDALLLLPRFERLRSRAFSDDAALRLAARTATSLGVIGDARAGRVLLAAAKDGTFPELAAAAATALGALGPGCPAEAPAVLRSLLGHDDRRVSLAARGALQRCGRQR